MWQLNWGLILYSPFNDLKWFQAPKLWCDDCAAQKAAWEFQSEKFECCFPTESSSSSAAGLQSATMNHNDDKFTQQEGAE